MKHCHSIAMVAAGALLLSGAAVQAQSDGKFSDDVIKIGIIDDMSSLYADSAGMGSVYSAQMAVDEFGGAINGTPIEIIYIDHFNKPDVASAAAREWFDTENVDALMNVAGSSTALAAIEVAKERNKIVMLSGPGSTRITNDACTPTTVHYSYDNYALAHGAALELIKQGLDTWFFITADVAFGHDLVANATKVLNEHGGKVLGEVRVPLNASDFSSALLQAQASGAKVIALANGGADAANSIKQAAEFGIMNSDQTVAALVLFITDVHSLGLEAVQGMQITNAFYWNRDEDTRAYGKRFFEEMGRMPSYVQGGVYSSTLTYLKAVQAVGTDETNAVMEQMKSVPINDMFAKNGKIRADGRMIHDMYLYEVKSPSESEEPWDYYKLVSTIPAEEAFQPLSESTCPLVTKAQ